MLKGKMLQSNRGTVAGFREDKLAQATQHLLDLDGGSLELVGLERILYILDRRFLLSTGRPSIGGEYLATSDGPFLVQLHDLVRYERPGPNAESLWMRHFDVRDRRVVLVQAVELRVLSRLERSLLTEILTEFRNLTYEEVIDKIEGECPEWLKNEGGRFTVADILVASGKSVELAKNIEEKIKFEQDIASRCND
jgi:hypothetical protein